MEASSNPGPSRTALLVAGYRARLTDGGSPLCHDPWARALAGEEGLALSRALDGSQPHMELWLGVRTAFLDGAVARLSRVAPQVVLLGAGLDTRAARLASPGLRFFEVDAPATQRWKLRRLAELPEYPRDVAVYVSCDFETEDFLSRLTAAGFDPGMPAVFVWEGVTYYLSEPAVRATLRRVAAGCHPDTTLLFDFVGRDMAEGRVRHAEDRQTHRMVADLGEPFRFGTNDVLPVLYEEGFRRVRVTSFDEACLELTGTYDRARKFRFQYLAEATIA
ncbi:MAG: class I SAM-dependent methyltransferase [Myxococcota bacterium]